jgi:HK97 gp10 family phage protein
MAKASFKIKGVDKLIKRIQTLDVSIQQEAKQLVFDAATDIEVEAIRNVAVDTGRLRASIDKQPTNNGFGAIVSANTNYAVFLEFGTRKQRPQPYMTPAFLRVSTTFVADLKALLKKQKI